jgi:hypothetical protein
METTTPFDLNRAIEQWRGSLEQSPAFRRENLDELETHLRDSVAVLQPRGLSEEEAFLVAARRAGSGAILGAEFGKVNARNLWLDRVLWMLVGNLLFWFVGGLLSLIGSGLLFVGIKEFGAAGSNSSSYLYVAVFSTAIQLLMFAGALVLCWRLFTSNWGPATKWLANNSRSSARFTAIAAIGIVGVMLAQLVRSSSLVLLSKYVSAAEVGRFVMGRSLGGMVASLVETAVFVILALWLARRRLLAKNRA